MRSKKSQGGYTMIQTIAYIAIIGLIGSTAISFFGKAMSRYKLTRLSQQVIEMQKAIDRRYVTKNEYTGLNIQILQSENLLPKDMTYKNNVLYHKYGGTVTVTPEGEFYTLTFNAIPKSACMELAQQNWGLDPRVVLSEMTIGTYSLRWNCGTTANCKNMPLGTTDASTVCSGSTNNISWRFY